MIIALKAWPEFTVHVRGALRNGLTELEIREAIVQATVYCGAPAGVAAFKCAEKVIEEMIASGEHVRQLKDLSPDFESYTKH